MKTKSFYEFYQKVTKENQQPPGQPQAGAGAAPPAPGTAPQSPPAAGNPAAPQGQSGAGTAPPVPAPDPAVQQLQQLMAPMAAQIQPLLGKIQDQKMKQALEALFKQGGQAKQPQPGQQPPAPPTGQAPPGGPAGQPPRPAGQQ